jgi:hypothetical protein
MFASLNHLALSNIPSSKIILGIFAYMFLVTFDRSEVCLLNFVFVSNFLIFASQRSEFTLCLDLAFSLNPGLKGKNDTKTTQKRTFESKRTQSISGTNLRYMD